MREIIIILLVLLFSCTEELTDVYDVKETQDCQSDVIIDISYDVMQRGEVGTGGRCEKTSDCIEDNMCIKGYCYLQCEFGKEYSNCMCVKVIGSDVGVCVSK